jgi:8-oxo-dGTP pyrophosphatase MutT (NUDIX family)
MVDRRPIKDLVSAGGVVYRSENGFIDMALCGRRNPILWGLPKGTPNPGESLEETALREVNEETGLNIALEGPLGHIVYWFTPEEEYVHCHKKVYFYLMRHVGGNMGHHDLEYDVVKWFHAEEALRAMTYPSEIQMVEKALVQLTKRFTN